MIRRRMKRPTPTSTALARNGIRQPQLRNAASLVIACTSANTLVERSRPAGTPICGHDPKKPRRPGGACSTDISTAPPHSPPTPMPCANRSTTSRTGAITPIDAKVGRQADQERRDPHDQQRQDEHRLAADAVAEVPEHDPADRPCGEADGVRAERQQRADQRLCLREEQVTEDQRRGGAVQKEVVPLDGRADEAGQRDFTHGLCAFLVHGPRLPKSKRPERRRTRQSGRPNHTSESAPPANRSTIAPPANAAVTSRSISREESRVPRFA